MANTMTGFLDERLDKDGNRVYSYPFPSNSLIGPRQPFTKPGQQEYLKRKAIDDANKIALAKQNETANFMDTPAGSVARGLVSDIYAGGKNLQEGFKTNLNQLKSLNSQYLVEPMIGFLSDEDGKSMIPNVTTENLEGARKNLDTTVDITKTPLPDDSIYKKIINPGSDSIIPGGNWAIDTFNFLKGGNVTDALKNIADDTPDIVPGITAESITDKFNKDVADGKLTDASQSDVTSVITKTSEVTNSTGEITAASNLLTGAIGTKDDTKTDKLTGAINGFMDKLDTPGFQTALAMHMEAKNGGDVTSVLFEGMKVKKKAKKDALAAHANNLAVSKAELQILKLYQDLNKADEPSKNLINAATTLMEKQYELGDQSTGAAFAISSMAMGIKKKFPNMSEYEALMQAVQLADKTKALEKDKWYTWGGKFDASKLFTAAPPVVSTGVPNSKADMLKQLMASNPGKYTEQQLLDYISITQPSLQ